MKRLVGEDFMRLFQTFDDTAFRLETRDHYAVSDEAEAYVKFLAGEPFDLEWHEAWLAGIRDIAASGRRLQRVRLVSEPPTDYQRFELVITPTNQEAGEDIRVLPRSDATDLDLPSYDFWLFDENRVAVMRFDVEGVFHGVEMVEEGSMVTAHQAARDRAISRAVPYAQYIAAHPVHA